MTDFVSDFEHDYRTGTAPWVIDQPQPAVVRLEREGWIRGAVLDVGCGTGEHTIFLANLNYDVYGVDSSPTAIARARANAVARGVQARFAVGDALHLDGRYGTVLDSALFHVYGLDRARYVRALHRVTGPGALVHVLALADIGPRRGPQINDSVIQKAFRTGWVVEALRLDLYRCQADGAIQDLPAWLARIRRTR